MRYDNVLNEIFGFSKKEKEAKEKNQLLQKIAKDPSYKKRMTPREMELYLLGTKANQEQQKKKDIKGAEFADKYMRLKKKGKEKQLQKLVKRYA